MTFLITRPHFIRQFCLPLMITAAFALALTGCGAASPSASSPESDATREPSITSTVAASPTAEASASAASGPCLPSEIIAAIEEVARANFEPETPLNEVADAIEALDLSSAEDFAEVRDELVIQLRDPDPDQTRQELVHVANVFLSDAGAPQC
jgi:hypothetical protein